MRIAEERYQVGQGSQADVLKAQTQVSRMMDRLIGLAREQPMFEANLLRDRVKPLLTEAEWEKFEVQVGQAKRVAPLLESYGQWTERRSNVDDDDAADAAKE